MRRTLSLASELSTDDNTRRYIDVITYNGLGVDNDSTEVGKIESLTDIGVIRDLEMIFPGEPVKPEVEELELAGIHELIETVVSAHLVVVEPCTTHSTDVIEFGTAHQFLKIRCIYLLGTTGISRVPEQVGIDDVLELIVH